MNKRASIIKGILFLLLFAFALGLYMVNVWDPDFWWHLKTGEWIVKNGALPKEDPFSFATLQSDPYTPIDRVRFILTQYWLAQIIMYKIYALWGFAGISILRAIILALTIATIGLILRLNKVHSILVFILLFMAIFLLRGSTGERPQLFSFLFAAILIYLLERHRSSERTLTTLENNPPPPPFAKGGMGGSYAIPFLMALWSNFHGFYIYGVTVILIYISSEWLEVFLLRMRGKRDIGLRPQVIFTAVGVGSILATCINPNTYHGILDHLRYQPFVYYKNIQEMLPTYKIFIPPKEPIHFVYFGTIIILGLLIAVDAIRRRRAVPHHIGLFIFNAVLSLSALRFIPYFAISGPFLLGMYLAPIFPSRAFEKRRWMETGSLVMIFIIIVGSAFISKTVSIKDIYRTGVNDGSYPNVAVTILKGFPTKRIFNHYTWGGYLIWTLYPKYKVFIDGRGLNQEIFLQYEEVISASKSGHIPGKPKWRGILDSYQIDYILLNSGAVHIGYALLNDPDWRLIYADNISLLFIRSKDEFRDIIKTYNLPPQAGYEAMIVYGLAETLAEGSKEEKVKALIFISDSYLKINNKEDAKAAIRKALELDPQNPETRSYAKAIGLE